MKRLGRFLMAALKVTLGFFRLAVPRRVQVGDVKHACVAELPATTHKPRSCFFFAA